MWFETRCRTVKRGGKFEVESFPEDWHFSKMLHERGLRVMATKVLACQHWGMAPFPNDRAWGSVHHDDWHDDCAWLTPAGESESEEKKEEVASCP